MKLSPHLTFAERFPQFIVSKIVIEDGEVKKYPCNPHGIPKFSHKDPANWLTLDRAMAKVAELNARDKTTDYRLGFSITAETKLFFYDIDNKFDPDTKTWSAYDPETKTWSSLVNDACATFNGAFIEVSQSGMGLHILARYTGEAPLHLNKNINHTELYTHDRFIMFSGNPPIGDWNFNADSQFRALVIQDFTKDKTPPASQSVMPMVESILTDEQVIANARKRPSKRKEFGPKTGADFNDLYDANVDVLVTAYPAKSSNQIYGESEADQALANMIAVQTGDEQQITRIMWTSKLVRNKWYEHATYLPNTVLNALIGRKSILSPQNQSTASNDTSQAFCADDMPQEYQDCYFILAHKKTYSIKYAGLLSKDVFNMCYTTPHMQSNPYKIFQGHASTTGHILDIASFKPEYPHGQIIEEEDLRTINIYKPINIKMREGDMSPFFDFFDRMLPNKRDQHILLSYVAVLVQNPGLKAMWAPVIQGVEGCGKSFFADMVARVLGEKYTHRAKSSELESNFSGHWFAKLLMLVEDVALKHSKLEDALKPLITATRYAFEPKGCDIFMGDFPLNFIITANNVDIIKKEEETRRYSFFMCAQQTREDRIKAGFTNLYFDGLANWREKGGQQFFAYFLHHYIPDPEFDFSKGCRTAPDTSTTDQAIEENRSPAQLLIQEAINSGRAGFKGGFISGTMLTRLFSEQRRLTLPDNQRSKVLRNLGYILHPQLVNGRASRLVNPDGNQPALFVTISHPTITNTYKDEIMKAYEDAQR